MRDLSVKFTRKTEKDDSVYPPISFLTPRFLKKLGIEPQFGKPIPQPHANIVDPAEKIPNSK